ncbi:MAG: tRNA (adenosine(37)-N6)-threonylcarbamoyltransferase complex ATPase subunit type 1 TsaE [Bacteroidales bacterium]|nr:tRNA (adenosine(37)-N6)-threonylcarbamoyltransferase complex ATPase subunit type 1 TsaE [Bacteroidales bacterium]
MYQEPYTSCIIREEKELPALANHLLQKYPNNRIFAFHGEMGVGKTTLIKVICDTLQVAHPTSSPTFAIVNEYHTQVGEPIYHFDLYRINKVEELRQIGIDDYLSSGAYCFVEWAEKLEVTGYEMVHVYIKLLPDRTREIDF